MAGIINNLSIPNITGLILVISSIIGLFIINRQARASEKSLKLKIVELQELANRIDNESKKRIALVQLHHKEELKRMKDTMKLWNHINSTSEINEDIRYSEYIIDNSEQNELIKINTYFTLLLRDFSLIVFQLQDKDFINSDINKNLHTIVKYFFALLEAKQIDKKRVELLNTAYNNRKRKQKDYNFEKMTPKEVKKSIKKMNNEYSEDLNRINKKFTKELSKITPDLKTYKNELNSIIEQIAEKINQQLKTQT